MIDTLKEHLKKIGKKGGNATLEKHGLDHYKNMVSIRELKKKGLVKP